jgi:hypothetical protein
LLAWVVRHGAFLGRRQVPKLIWAYLKIRGWRLIRCFNLHCKCFNTYRLCANGVQMFQHVQAIGVKKKKKVACCECCAPEGAPGGCPESRHDVCLALFASMP